VVVLSIFGQTFGYYLRISVMVSGDFTRW
jgi:hypothetical protein